MVMVTSCRPPISASRTLTHDFASCFRPVSLILRRIAHRPNTSVEFSPGVEASNFDRTVRVPIRNNDPVVRKLKRTLLPIGFQVRKLEVQLAPRGLTRTVRVRDDCAHCRRKPLVIWVGA